MEARYLERQILGNREHLVRTYEDDEAEFI